MRHLWLSLLSCSLYACAAATPAPLGADSVPPADAVRPAPPKASAPVPDDVVLRAARPFRAQRNADGELLDQTHLLDELAKFDVLCLGEAHDAARDHFAELAITDGLAQRAQFSGRALGVGFEMFQAPYGPALQAYGIGRVDDAGLRLRTHYDELWGFPYAYYQPVLALGRARGLPLKALNADRELTHAVAEKGLAGLTPKERRELPDMNMDNAAHRAAFDRLMANHPHGQGMDMENFYAAQVVWDETMADNAASWVALHAPSRQLIVLAGSAHCRDEAIPARIERREPLRVANVRLSEHGPADSEGYAYTLIFDGN